MSQFSISLSIHFVLRNIFLFSVVRAILRERASFFITVFNGMKPAVLLSALFLWGAGVQASILTVTSSGPNVQVQWQRSTSGPVTAYEANVSGPGVSSSAQTGTVTARVGSGTHTYRLVERISYSGSSVPQQNTVERTITITDQGLAPTSVSVNPANLSCTQSELTLSWPAVTSSRYAVETRNRAPGGTWPSSWSRLATNLSSLSFSVSPLTEGREYEFRVSAASRSPGGAYSVWRNSAVVRKESCAVSAPSETPFDASPSLVTDAEISETDSVGVISGQFRVNEGGAATYTVPVTVAPGTAGVAPQLALAYSSHSGNGLLGKGWSLEGLSAISRCRQTLMQDRKALPISWNKNDRFCLNGTRLLLISGEYGSPDSEYKTEIDTFVKVTAKGGTQGKPDYFLMEAKDGSVTRFGGPGDDLSETKVYDGNDRVQTDKVLNWSISQFEDSVGNAIKFVYSASRHYHRIARIDYAFGATTTAGASVAFEYESRPDPLHSFLAGYRLSNTERLKRVIAKNGSTEIRRYVLNYAAILPSTTISKVSRVISMEECVGETNCLPKTTFAWLGHGSTNYKDSAATDYQVDVGSLSVLSPDFADVDGDGVLDPVWISGSRVRYRLDDAVHIISDVFVRDGEAQLRVLDYNLDGRDDVLVYDATASNKWRLLLSTPQASIGSSGKVQWRLKLQDITLPFAGKEVQFIDFNSDGILDAVQLDRGANALRIFKGERSGQSVSSSTFYRFSQTSIAVALPNAGLVIDEQFVWGDFNLDGRVDIAHGNWAYDQNLRMAVWLGFNILLSTESGGFTLSHTLASDAISEGLKALDINGDGLTDVVYRFGSSGWYYQLNNGNGFESKIKIAESFAEVGAQFVDLNYDGHPDVFWRSGSKILHKTWLPETQQFSATATFRSSLPWGDSGIGYSYRDLDNNGSLDLIGVAADVNFSTGGRGIRAEHSTKNSAQFIGIIRNGLGAETNITYSPLNGLVDDNLYSTYEGFDVSSNTREVCKGGYSIPSPPGYVPRTCHDETVYTVNSAEFYRQVNDPYAYLPEGTQILRPQQVAPVVEMKGAFPVVAAVHSSAPTSSDPEHMAGKRYRYRLNLFQAAGRGALGFRELVTEDLQTQLVTRNLYRQDWPFLGQPLSTVVLSPSGNTVKESINNSVIFEYSSTMASTLSNNGSAALKSLQVYTDYLVDIEYDLDAIVSGWLRETVTRITPDAYGNTVETDILKKDMYGNTYRQTTINTYGTSEWYKEKGRLTHSEVTHERYTESTGETDTVVREADFTYYESGNLEGMLRTEVANAQDSSGKVTTTHYYDNFGNKVYSLAVGGDGTKRLSDNTVYDSRGRYADKTFALFNKAISTSDDSGSSSGYSTQRDAAAGNAKATIQLTSSVTSRNALGLPTQTTQYTGATTTTTAKAAYTPFGNAYFSTDSGGSYQLTTAALGSGYHCPYGAAFHTRTRVAGGAESITCHDKIGREIRRGKSSFQGDWLYVDTSYGLNGLVFEVSEPYKSTADAHTTFAYDALGRTVSVIYADFSSTYTLYQGLGTIVVNDDGQRKTEYRDAAGDLFQARDDDGNTIRYYYTGDGQLKSMTGPSGYPSTISYDASGRKTGMTDPDKGTWSYKYNSLGELVCQQDAKRQTIISSHDFAGRLIGRIERAAGGTCDNPTGVIQSRATWKYDTAARGMGKLAVEWSGGASASENSADYKKAFNYDSLGRASTVKTTLRGHKNVLGDHWEKITYDQYSRPWKTWDAARNGNTFTNNGIEQKYDAYGYPYQILDAHSGAEYYRVEAIDDRGNVSADSLGDGVIRRGFEHDPDTGRLTNITAYDVQNRALQDLTLEWDSLGNLETRYEKGLNKQGDYRDLWESFGYDNLNRLTDYTVSGDGNHITSVKYNALGNITYKSDVGHYSYNHHAVRPHAVKWAGSHSYSYDSNGSVVIDGRGRIFTYTTADQVSRITKGGHATYFHYDANRSRYKRVDTNGGSTTTTLYLGSVEKIHHADNTQEWRRYIHDSVMLTQVLNTSGSVTATRTQFMLKDHLGSVNVITDGAGKITDLLAFDPWGKRRAETNWTALPLAATESTFFIGAKPKTNRGFTGHQMVDEMDIIHMGGRIYDPLLGRFLQADPFIQSPSTTASLNRYSYVWNNPLNATDPSGFFLSSLWKEIRPFVGAIVGVVLAVTVPWAAEAWGPVVIGMISGAAGAAANGTSIFKGAMFGAFSGIAYGAGGAWGAAIWGGTESYMNGGAFGRGFIAAGIGAMGGSGGLSWEGFVRSAVLGGVATEVTGGKFKNGAASAAFMYAVSAGAKTFKAKLNHPGGHYKKYNTVDGAAPVGRDSFSEKQLLDIDSRMDELRGALKGRGHGNAEKTGLELNKNDALTSLGRDYQIEIAAIMATDGTIQELVTNYHHSSVTTFLKVGSGQSVWHNHPGPVNGTYLGLQTDYRGMSSGDYTVAEKSGGWSYALHEDGSYWGVNGRSGRVYQYNFESGAFEYTNKKY